jgi:hypothetical protein
VKSIAVSYSEHLKPSAVHHPEKILILIILIKCPSRKTVRLSDDWSVADTTWRAGWFKSTQQHATQGNILHLTVQP